MGDNFVSYTWREVYLQILKLMHEKLEIGS